MTTALETATSSPRVRTLLIALGPAAPPVAAAAAAFRQRRGSDEASHDDGLGLRELCTRIAAFPRAMLVAAGGAQGAWGLGLCAAADLVVAGRSTTFDGGGIAAGIEEYLLAYLPVRAAKWLALSAGTLSAGEALTLGFVNAVTDDDRLLDDAAALAARIGMVPPDVLHMKKAANNFSLRLPVA